MGRRQGADGKQEMVAVLDSGEAGVDSVTYLEGPDVYIVHVGSGLPSAKAARGSLEVTVPTELLERACWLVALALEHDDDRKLRAAVAPPGGPWPVIGDR